MSDSLFELAGISVDSEPPKPTKGYFSTKASRRAKATVERWLNASNIASGQLMPGTPIIDTNGDKGIIAHVFGPFSTEGDASIKYFNCVVKREDENSRRPFAAHLGLRYSEADGYFNGSGWGFIEASSAPAEGECLTNWPTCKDFINQTDLVINIGDILSPFNLYVSGDENNLVTIIGRRNNWVLVADAKNNKYVNHLSNLWRPVLSAFEVRSIGIHKFIDLLNRDPYSSYLQRSSQPVVATVSKSHWDAADIGLVSFLWDTCADVIRERTDFCITVEGTSIHCHLRSLESDVWLNPDACSITWDLDRSDGSYLDCVTLSGPLASAINFFDIEQRVAAMTALVLAETEIKATLVQEVQPAPVSVVSSSRKTKLSKIERDVVTNLLVSRIAAFEKWLTHPILSPVFAPRIKQRIEELRNIHPTDAHAQELTSSRELLFSEMANYLFAALKAHPITLESLNALSEVNDLGYVEEAKEIVQAMSRTITIIRIDGDPIYADQHFHGNISSTGFRSGCCHDGVFSIYEKHRNSKPEKFRIELLDIPSCLSGSLRGMIVGALEQIDDINEFWKYKHALEHVGQCCALTDAFDNGLKALPSDDRGIITSALVGLRSALADIVNQSSLPGFVGCYALLKELAQRFNTIHESLGVSFDDSVSNLVITERGCKIPISLFRTGNDVADAITLSTSIGPEEMMQHLMAKNQKPAPSSSADLFDHDPSDDELDGDGFEEEEVEEDDSDEESD